MAKKIQLSIDDPCHQNWDAMTEAEKGRFCKSCQKEVIDFSMMSDREIAQFFKKPSTGSVCGRFMRDQLDREIAIPKKRIPWFKYVMTAAFPAFMASLKGNAQVKSDPTILDSLSTKWTLCRLDKSITLGMVGYVDLEIEKPLRFKNAKLDEITGRVIDPDGNPIANASVKVKNSRTEAIADSNGYFKLKLKAKKRRVELQASQFLYKDASFLITRKDYDPEMELVLDYQVFMMGGLRVRRYISEKEEPAKELIIPALNTYPNPIQRGMPLTIETSSDKEQSFQIEIRDIAGNLLFNQTQRAIKGINRFQVATDSKWTAGMFIVQLTGEMDKLVRQAKLLIQ